MERCKKILITALLVTSKTLEMICMSIKRKEQLNYGVCTTGHY
jgi:hypothetical protein